MYAETDTGKLRFRVMPLITMPLITTPRLRRCFWVLCFVACSLFSQGHQKSAAEENVSPFFLAGADFSHVAWIESTGAEYRDQGKKEDPFVILKRYGINCIRLREYTSSDAEAESDPYNQINNLKYNLPLAKRVKEADMKLILNFHYSDTWADPGTQTKPKAWEGLSFDQLKTTLYEYNRKSIAAYKEIGALPDMVQIGNEITPGMIWPDGKNNSEEQWKKFAILIKEAIRGVGDGAGNGADMPKIIIQIDRGGDWKKTEWFFDHLIALDVRFDIIGQSYYPFWHGTLDELKDCLVKSAEKYDKPILLCEVGFPWAETNWKGEPLDPIVGIQAGKQGQVEFVEKIGQILKEVPNERGIGLLWWAAEFLPVKNVNMAGFETRSFFDKKGNALPVIETIGNLARVKKDEIPPKTNGVSPRENGDVSKDQTD